MKQWLKTLSKLKAVQQAREDFLIRDFIDRTIIGPMFLDRLAADIRAAEGGNWTLPSMQAGQGFADDRYLE